MFERLEDRIVFAVQLDVGPIPDVVIVSPGSSQFDLSTGPILPASSGAVWANSFAGQAIYQTSAANVRVEAPNFIAVDSNKTYALSGWARSGDEFGQRYQPNNLQSLGFASYDRDHLQILPQHVLRFAGAADTTLAAPLNPGATTIQLTNAAGWSNAVGAAAGTRGIAWYGYQDSTGATYADYTYTRNTAMGGTNGMWLPGSINGNLITLASPWAGPALPAGTAVRNTGVGSDESFVALDSQSVPDDWTWTQYAGVFGGQVLQNGNDSITQFRPGTAYIRPVILANEHGTAGNFISWGDVTVAEVAAGTPVVQLGPKIVDLSVISGADQRHALSPATWTWGESLVKVNTASQYALTGRALNVVESEERPLDFLSFDIDKKLIHPLHVTKYGAAADTTLAAAVAPGDTSILVTNASGWSNDSFESADTRALAWYGYTDSTGHTYANYTYTRNVAFDFDNGLWQPGAIFYDANVGAYRINLVQPWSGPALGAGTAIRNAASGDLKNKPRVAPGLETRQEWVEYAATIGGSQWQNGARNEETFRPATVYIQPLFTSTLASGNMVIAPVGNAAGVENLTKPADQHVEVDLDVLAKNALTGVTGFLAGDYNSDGAIDSGDYVVWRKKLGATGLVPFTSADGNGDGKVDQADLQVWRSNSGKGAVVIESVATPKYGTASIANGPNGTKIIRYQSNAWFLGADVVTYTLRNKATNESFTSSVTVQVTGTNYEQNPTIVATLATQAQTAGNTAPKARDDTGFYNTIAGQTVYADGGRAASLFENDLDGTNTLVARLVSGPSNGSMKLNYDGTFEYTPNAGFVGTDSFRYEAFDGQFSETAVASITVYGAAEDLLLGQLKNVGIAIQNYHDVKKRMPLVNTATYFDASGNPNLSWRVHVLPYLGYQSLYNQFHLDEPWDSPNNLPLAEKMPNVFANPGDSPISTTTRFQIISGEGAPYYWRRSSGLLAGPTLSNFTDGTSNSFLVVETGADKAITWTKPEGTGFDPNNPLASLGTITGGRFHAVMADASTTTLPASIDPAVFKSLVTISGGEVENAATLKRLYVEDTTGLAGLQALDPVGNNLRNIAIAMMNYHDVKKAFPVVGAANFDDNGNPYLSWRVHILPYIEEQALYNKFHLDEPWDSPNNLPLLAEMPDVFRSPGDSASSTTTRLMTFTGKDASFGFRTAGQDQTGPSLNNITDGASHTIMFVEAPADKAAFWTKPDDLPFDKNNPLASLGTLLDKFRAAFFDAHTSILPSDISAETLSALVTRNGKEVVDSSIAGRETARSGLPKTNAGVMLNDFKATSLAMSTYSQLKNIFPIANSASFFDSNGMPLLSWRVHILPYLEYTNLYNKFKLNEPWDSPNNLPLLAEMPAVYGSVGDPWNSVTTRVMQFTGPNAPFLSKPSGNQSGPTIQSITDGTSKTFALVEAGAGAAVPWTKPTDVPFYANNPFSPLGDLGPVFITSFFDTATLTQSSSMSIDLLKAYITPKGGEDTANPPAIPNVPGVYVAQTAGNTVLNEFGADAFDIVLDKAPSSDVVVSVSVSDMAVATLDKVMLTFTAANWNMPQRAYVRGVDNFAGNPDQTVSVTVDVVDALSDNNYDPVAAQIFNATVRNDDFVPADYDHNGLIEQADYTTWRSNFGGNANTSLAADGNRNGVVDAGDYVFWRKAMPAPASGVEVALNAASPADVSGNSTTVVETAEIDIEGAFAAIFTDLSNASRLGQSTPASPAVTVGLLRSDLSDDLLLIISTRAASVREADLDLNSEASSDASGADDTAAFESAFAEDWTSLS
jgi:hypothetical protein